MSDKYTYVRDISDHLYRKASDPVVVETQPSKSDLDENERARIAILKFFAKAKAERELKRLIEKLESPNLMEHLKEYIEFLIRVEQVDKRRRQKQDKK